MDADGGGRAPGRQRRPAVMSDVGRLAGRLAPDGLARDQRQPEGAPGDAPARDRGDARARLPAQLGRPRAGHRPDQHARRGRLRHDAVRPGVDAVRDRARGPRGRLLHDRGQPQGAQPLLGVLRGRAPAVQGVDGILVIAPHLEAADALGHAPLDVPLVAVEAGPGRRRARWSRSISTRARSARPSICSISGTRPSGTSRGRRTGSSRASAIDGWRTTLEAAGAEAPPPLAGDWSARAGYDHRPAAERGPGGDRDLRRQRPDGAGRAAGDARGRPRRSRTRSAWSGSTTFPSRPTSRRR